MAAIYADPELARALYQNWFVSFDPGTKNPAFAVWCRGELLTSRRVQVPGALKKLDPVERCRQIAGIVGDAVRGDLLRLRLAGTPLERPTHVVMERPQFYTADKSKGDPNKLALLAILCGAVAVELGYAVVSYLPGEWCGGLKKVESGDPWKCPRGYVLRSRLRAAEIPRVQAAHDALDAAGVGLKALGRLEKSLPGTT